MLPIISKLLQLFSSARLGAFQLSPFTFDITNLIQGLLSNRLWIRARGINAAFTLAETLITLGIIGVVAAMTLPNLIQKNIERSTVAKLSKEYTVMLDAFRRMVDDNGTIDSYGETPKEKQEKLQELLPQYLKMSLCGERNNKCPEAKSYKRLNGNNAVVPCGTACFKSVLFDGAVVTFHIGGDCSQNMAMTNKGLNEHGKGSIYYGTYQHQCGDFTIDLNGKGGPNVFDKDAFKFKIVVDGIVPAGNSKENIWTETFKNQCLHKNPYFNNAGYCAAWVLQKKNMDYLRSNNLKW